MPPAAITGQRTAATICGSSIKVPICLVRSSDKKCPRWPPASSPCPNHRIDAMRLQPARLIDGSRRGNDLRTIGANPLQQIIRRQTEMKADKRRAKFINQISCCMVERHAAGAGRDTFRVNAELAVIRHQRLPPRRFTHGIRRWRGVGEEIGVPRPVGTRFERAQFSAQLLKRSPAAGSEPRPPAAQTASARRLS